MFERVQGGAAANVVCCASLLLATLSLAGCASPDKLLFLTNTNVGVGYNLATASGHIGYDRQEIDVSPDYPVVGGKLPVASQVSDNLSFSAPNVKQYFATGDAALIASQRIVPPTPIDRDAVKDSLTPEQRCALNLGCVWDKTDNPRRVSIVGTNSHVGLSVTTQNGALSSLDFGFGRQEAAMLPLRTTPGGDILPSAIASIDVTTTGLPASGLTINQFIATGGAADALSDSPSVKNAVADINGAKAIEAQAAALKSAAAAKEEAWTAAKTLDPGLQKDDFDKRFTLGLQARASDTEKADIVMLTMVGPDRKDTDKLTAADRKRIAELTRKAAGKLKADSDAAKINASLADQLTVGNVRDQLDITDLLNALYGAWSGN